MATLQYRIARNQIQIHPTFVYVVLLLLLGITTRLEFFIQTLSTFSNK